MFDTETVNNILFDTETVKHQNQTRRRTPRRPQLPPEETERRNDRQCQTQPPGEVSRARTGTAEFVPHQQRLCHANGVFAEAFMR
ncbi:MAG: hypothetical protein KTU85_09950 [Acidimicrobiia bacterium]|nr:hypothetical protein [Acidimicrobiia bacterium]MCY4458561.1 hypothetical protein [Acidimicrobiaceae bacterium]